MGGEASLSGRSRADRWTAPVMLVLALAFLALGVWQLRRRAEKLALIAAVDARVHAPPVDAPGPARWPRIGFATDAYRAVHVHGVFLSGHDTMTQAVTDGGPGFWVMTPLRTDQGWTVLVNRGFIAADDSQRAHVPPAGPLSVTGLLRLSEPHGGFLRRNDPSREKWYSRDVAAIGRAGHLSNLAPYFIDAKASADPWQPVGGLTVVTFPNNHLQYALTWFALAGLSAAGGIRAWRTRGVRSRSR